MNQLGRASSAVLIGPVAFPLTDRPVRGILTGAPCWPGRPRRRASPLAGLVVRDDQPLADTAAQVALALRDEGADLEAAGTSVIQVDEPALRETPTATRGRASIEMGRP
jgi:5-methyltetrahydropteroyltriglutamate--homocysteine methyltransferase